VQCIINEGNMPTMAIGFTRIFFHTDKEEKEMKGKKRVPITSIMAGLLTLALLLGVTGMSASADKPIVIGTPMSLYNPYGRDHVKGVELAIKELNAKGGVKVDGVMRQFKLVTTDTRDAEPGVPAHDAINATESLIRRENPDFIVGAFHRSEVLLAAMDMFARHELITFSGSPQTPAFTNRIKENREKYKYLFRAVPNAGQTGVFVGEWLGHISKELGINKLFIVAIDFEWAKATGNALQGVAKQHGWESVGSQVVPPGGSDFSTVLIQARRAGAELILLIHDLPQSAVFLSQWEAMEIPSLVMGIHAPPILNSAAWERYGDDLSYVLGPEMAAGGSVPVKKLPGSEDFVSNWVKEFGAPPETTEPNWMYETMYILADALERAGTLDKDTLIKAIEETDMKTLSGRVKFDKESHQRLYGLDPETVSISCGFQWIDGKRVPIFPPEIAEAEIKLPPWMKK
jgi:branched-chain amino acid transport system substrate-binding protein